MIKLLAGTQFGQQFGDILQIQPPLILRPLSLEVHHTQEIAHIVELVTPTLQTDEGTLVGAFLASLDQLFQGEASQASGLDAVEGRWIPTLL